MTSSIKFENQDVPAVNFKLTPNDHLGTFKARWGVSRMNYCIDPGLYALGSPTSASDVLVTANYKLSFDKLRSALPGINAWILVLNTNGINVWCAAGKRTFGTAELVSKITANRLTDLVTHRNLIVPQLGAPGISAHEVKKQTGFKVIYGPIRATDLPAFIESGYRATPAMRRKDFPFAERLALVPMELIPSIKYMAILLPVIFILSGLFGTGSFIDNAMTNSLFPSIMLFGGLVAGTIITPAALPWLPGKAFSFKAMEAGLITAMIIYGLFLIFSNSVIHTGFVLSMCLTAAALSSFLGMNFTGSSTYTSLSGVRKEMKIAVPMQAVAVISGLLVWITTLFITNA